MWASSTNVNSFTGIGNSSWLNCSPTTSIKPLTRAVPPPNTTGISSGKFGTFSVARGGDWVDTNVANDCGCSIAKVIAIKENSNQLDLTKSAISDIYAEGTDEQNIVNAIRSYYGALVNYLLVNLTHQFNNAESVPNFPEDVPVVFGGGTALVKGFMEVVNEQFNQDEFPIPVKEFVLVEDAHTAVARGCLSEAQLIEEENNENNKESA